MEDDLDGRVAAPVSPYDSGSGRLETDTRRTMGETDTQTSYACASSGFSQPAGFTELDGVIPRVRDITADLHHRLRSLGQAELVSLAAAAEELSRLVDHLQVVAAAGLDRARIAAEISDSWTTAAGDAQQEYKNTAEFMRHRLRISRREAWRRIRLGCSLTPAASLTGQRIAPELEVLAESAALGLMSGQAAQIVSMAMKRVQGCGTREDRASMESALTEVAATQDLDALSVLASAWINHVDPDGTAPSEQEKSELQGLFVRRKYRGLHRLDIFATEDQFETLMTALMPEASPRTGIAGADDGCSSEEGTCADLEGRDRAVPRDPRSHAQKCLDGLVASCRIALASGQLPANGGSKPQVMAIIPYEQLSERLGRKTEVAMMPFAGPVPASLPTASSRMATLRILPDTVIGKLPRICTYRGIL